MKLKPLINDKRNHSIGLNIGHKANFQSGESLAIINKLQVYKI